LEQAAVAVVDMAVRQIATLAEAGAQAQWLVASTTQTHCQQR